MSCAQYTFNLVQNQTVVIGSFLPSLTKAKKYLLTVADESNGRVFGEELFVAYTGDVSLPVVGYSEYSQIGDDTLAFQITAEYNLATGMIEISATNFEPVVIRFDLTEHGQVSK